MTKRGPATHLLKRSGSLKVVKRRLLSALCQLISKRLKSQTFSEGCKHRAKHEVLLFGPWEAFFTGAQGKKTQNKNKEKRLNVSVLRLLFSSLQRLFEQSECSGISQVRFPEITPRAVCADVLFANMFPLSTMPASCLQVVTPPARSDAPRAACAHVRTRGPNLGTYNTIVCSFPAACHDGRRGTFSFFRKKHFFLLTHNKSLI